MESDNNNRIKVFIRIRPPMERELINNTYIQSLNTKNNQLYISKLNKASVINTDLESFDKIETYSFDHIFTSQSTQKDLNEIIGKISLNKIFEGYNSTIFSYGQTGSGKTYSIEGNPDNPGLLLNILNDLYNWKKNNKVDKITIRITALQIYMEKISDLLSDSDKCYKLAQKDKSFEITNLNHTIIETYEEALNAFYKAQERRIVAKTKMNDTSSRGHVVYTFYIDREILFNTTKDNYEDTENIIMKKKILNSKFHLVDLAGSERISKSGTSGNNLKESISINKSLFALQGVVGALVNPKAINYKNPPFRDSKLTMFLKDSLGGNSITYLLANISPSYTEVSETISTLNFALSCTKIINNPTINKFELREEAKRRLYGEKKPISIKKKEIEMPWKNYELQYDYRSVQTEFGEIFYIENSLGNYKDIIVLLHACPSDSSEFLHWFPALSFYGYKIIAIDQPGYGMTKGKCHPCNSSYNCEKGGPCDIVISVLLRLGIFRNIPNITNSKDFKYLKNLKGLKKIIVGGYDWGGGISISLSLTYPNLISKAILFMPSYSEPTGNELKCLSVPVIIVWIDLDQFHVWSKWKNLAEKIPNKAIEIIKSKMYNKETNGQCYSSKSDLILRPIVVFLGEADPSKEMENLIEPLQKATEDIHGNRVEAKININFLEDVKDNENFLLERCKVDKKFEAATKFREIYEEIGDAIYERFQNKDFQICEILRNLPEISYETLHGNPSLLVQMGIWKHLPLNYEVMLNSPRYFKGRKVLVLIPCSPYFIINGKINKKFLTYEENENEKFLTLGVIQNYDKLNNAFIIEVRDSDGNIYSLQVKDEDIYLYNNPQEFYKNNLNEYEFEDGIKSNYNHPIIKAKLLEISIKLADVIENFDFINPEIESLQHKVIITIRRSLNLTSFYKGVIRERFGRTDCIGKMAINGQGQCHGLSSTISGFLFPFSEIFGIDILYRGGFSLVGSNKSDKHLRVFNNIEKHQWIQVNLRPGMNSYVVDLWYQEQFEDETFLFLALENAMKSVSYPHPKILLKNIVKYHDHDNNLKNL